MTDWKEHNGGPQPVDDETWVDTQQRHGAGEDAVLAGVKSWRHFEGASDIVGFRVINQHLIDAARLEGIRLGLEAAHKAANAVCEADPDSHAEDAIMAVAALDPATIAREATLDTLTAEAQANGMGYDQHDAKRHPAALIGQEPTND